MIAAAQSQLAPVARKPRSPQVQIGPYLIYPLLYMSKVGAANDGGCLPWTATLAQNGYGQFGIRHAETRKPYVASAHRVGYMLAHGEIPASLVLDHTCSFRQCVNPDHLRVCTQKQNSEHRPNDNPHNASTGVRGVSRRGSYFDIHVGHHGVLHRDYGFTSLDSAIAALATLRSSLHTHNDDDRRGGADEGVQFVPVTH